MRPRIHGLLFLNVDRFDFDESVCCTETCQGPPSSAALFPESSLATCLVSYDFFLSIIYQFSSVSLFWPLGG